MSLTVEGSTNRPNPCCSETVKNGTYGLAVTLVALAVIFGALVLVTQHFGLNWGPLNDPVKQVITFLGEYTFVPLAASTSLLALLIVVGAVWKCPSPKNPPNEKEEGSLPPASTHTWREPIPTSTTNPKSSKPVKPTKPKKST